MAAQIAKSLKGHAAITTASDARYAFPLDAPPAGYALAIPNDAKPVMASLLNGEELCVTGDANWLKKAGYPVSSSGSLAVFVTEKIAAGNGLTDHPRTLVVGIGCARGASANKIILLIEAALEKNDLCPMSLAAHATIDIKSDEAGMHEAASHFDVPLKLFPAAQLARQNVPNPSDIVRAETGTPSVAEACASLAGELVVEKLKRPNATCATGRVTAPLNISEFGFESGQVNLVGIGPGDIAQRTASVSFVLQQRDFRKTGPLA